MIRPGSVKICSLQEIEHARFVCDAGADLFGLIFVPGVRREVTTSRARHIVQAVRVNAAGTVPLAVGVFVDATADRINALIRDVGLDLVQLHGKEPPELLAQLDAPVVKAFRPGPGMNAGDVERSIEVYARVSNPPLAYLIDGFHESHHGGEGIRADWTMVAALARLWPIMLAGGLNPENVSAAIEIVGPAGVDVSSGAETDGVKDGVKIAAFVAAAKRSFAERTD